MDIIKLEPLEETSSSFVLERIGTDSAISANSKEL